MNLVTQLSLLISKLAFYNEWKGSLSHHGTMASLILYFLQKYESFAVKQLLT